MWLQTISASIFSVSTVIPHFQTQKVIMDITKVIKHIAQAFIFRMGAYLVFIGSHCFSPALPPTLFGVVETSPGGEDSILYQQC
jgi:hypothetical protein